MIKDIFLSASELPENAENLGLVSGYCSIGTSFVTDIVSSVTDFFGKKSETYKDKIAEAEDDAIEMIKNNCNRLGGNAVYNIHVNIMEATKGHGQIIIYIFGTAAKIRKA